MIQGANEALTRPGLTLSKFFSLFRDGETTANKVVGKLANLLPLQIPERPNMYDDAKLKRRSSPQK